MKQLYTKTSKKINCYTNLVIYIFLIAFSIGTSYGQVRVPFSPRTANATPTQTSYTIKGDFAMVGNTNTTLVNYSENSGNDRDVMYVDIDTDSNTMNSSSATLTFSRENGAIPDCSKILYAGLYWSGRAFGDRERDSRTFTVTKNGLTKTFDKRKVSIRGPNATAYTDITARATDISFPTNGNDRNMYSAYAEVTDYVKANGIGEYFVADIATREGNSDATGYYAGWGMVVVYENSKMRYRDVTVFDGHAYVINNTANFEIPISGFNAVQNGEVNFKLGLMAGEGDVRWTGDYLEMLRQDTNTFERLSHSGNTTDNFFNSSIQTGANPRNPNLVNNTGLDIVMFDVDNGNNNTSTIDDNKFIDNNQTSTTIKYGSSLDTYIIFNVTFAVDAYVPETEVLLSNTSINGTPIGPTNNSIEPGQDTVVDIEIRNTGTEAINDAVLTIPIPSSIDPSNFNITFNTYPPFTTPNIPSYDGRIGPNGAIVWNLGTIPLTGDPNDVLADIAFTLTVTKNCATLNDSAFDPKVTLNGNLSGVGATSKIAFNSDLIQGRETNGLCIGDPIVTPTVIDIEYLDYVNEPPKADNPAPTAIQCITDLPDPDINVVINISDNSGITPTVAFVSDNSDEGSNPEIITRTYSVTDDCGNSINVTQQITISDTTDPTITCPTDVNTNTSNDGIGNCTTTVALGTPVANDNCSVDSIIAQVNGATIDPATYEFGIGNTTVNWIVTDTAGNSANCNQTVTVTDNENPTALCKNITIQLNDRGVAFITPDDINNGSNDNCGIASLDLDVSSFSCGDIGDNTVELTVTDNNGLTDTCNAIVTVQDVMPPVAACKNITVQLDANGNASITPDDINDNSFDNCAIASLDLDVSSFSCANIGNNPVQLTVTDVNGLKSTCNATVIVQGATSPTALCKNITVQLDDTGNAFITPGDIDNGSSDNCGIASLNLNITNFTCANVGDNTVELTVINNNGLSATCNAIVTVQDVTPPRAICKNITVQLNASGNASIIPSDIDDGSNDNCAIVLFELDIKDFTCANIGDNTVELKVTDINGLTDTCNATVTIENSINPTITCPEDVLSATSNDGVGNCSTTVALGVPQATNNCIINSVVAEVNGSVIDPLTFQFNLGTTEVTWTVTDNSGNSTSCTQNVTITDDENPTITCPEDVTVTVEANNCTTDAANVILGTPSFSDNCVGATVTNDAPTIYPLGDTTVTWTVTDGVGNTATCTQTVTITDNEDPVITQCPSAVSITVDPDSCTTVATNVTLGTPLFTDNCTTETTITNDAPSAFPLGETTVTWTVTDGSGNTATCEQIVTVTDNQDPVIIECASNITVNTDPGACNTNASNVNLDSPVFTDNCTSAVASNDAPNVFPLGDTTVTWTITDESGNTTTCTQTVTVSDDENPTITCPENITVAADPGLCSASNVNLGTPLTDDNCGVATVSNNALEPYALGETTITWTVVDNSGNTATCEQTVTVIDGELPEVICPPTLTISVDEGTCEATNVSLGDMDVQDCTDIIIVNDAPSAFPLGDTTVIWTVTDLAGNSQTCEQLVTVEDNIPPTFVEALPADITIECNTIPTEETLTAVDNCGNATVTYEEVKINGNCVSNYTLQRIWTATDNAGLTTVHTQTITVQDTTRPVFVGRLPGEVTVECNAIPTPETITATDNCGSANVTTNDVNIEGTCEGTYTIERTYTATDECGLTASYTQIINVQDTTAPSPVGTLERNITVNCKDIPEVQEIEFRDSCSSDVIVVFNEINGFDDTVFEDYQITRTWTVRDACNNQETYTQTLNVMLDEIITSVNAPDECYNSGIIDLNEFLTSENTEGTWEIIQGNTDAELVDSLFNPTTLTISNDFKPGSESIDYTFRHTGLDNGCINITEVTMAINADCVVLPCGDSDIEITKALTPNGDGINETFDIIGIDLCGFIADVKIFNRWGALVYESDRYPLGKGEGSWQGEAHKSSIGSSGKVPNGTYYYIINLKNSGLQPFTGPIYIGTK